MGVQNNIFFTQIAPCIGVFIGVLMFGSSFPVVLKARKTKDGSQLNTLIYCAIVGMTGSLLGYAYVLNNYYVFSVSFLGFLFGLFYFTSAYAIREDQRQLSEILLIFWAALLTFCGIITTGACKTKDAKQILWGVLQNAITLLFYGAPLSVMATVVKTKSTELLNPIITIANTLNGAFWVMYGSAIRDFFIYFPNAVGVFLGIVQLVLFLIFPRRLKSAGEKDAGGQPSSDTESGSASLEGESKSAYTNTNDASDAMGKESKV